MTKNILTKQNFNDIIQSLQGKLVKKVKMNDMAIEFTTKEKERMG